MLGVLFLLFVLIFWLSQITYSNIFLSLVPDPFNLSEDSTTCANTSECDAKKTLNLLYPIIGLTAVSLIICMMYLYTRSLDNRPVETDTV